MHMFRGHDGLVHSVAFAAEFRAQIHVSSACAASVAGRNVRLCWTNRGSL